MMDSDSVVHCSRLSTILNYIRILKKTKKIYRFWNSGWWWWKQTCSMSWKLRSLTGASAFKRRRLKKIFMMIMMRSVVVYHENHNGDYFDQAEDHHRADVGCESVLPDGPCVPGVPVVPGVPGVPGEPGVPGTLYLTVADLRWSERRKKSSTPRRSDLGSFMII